jgi:hypothetical protein
MESITVCVRIRPKVNSQNNDESPWKIESNSLISGKSKEIFSVGKSLLANN